MEYQIHRLITALGISLTLTAAEIPKNSPAYKIYQNECNANPKYLIHWNKGENFPSLGIGHFIWYPRGIHERFDESFPRLLQFLKDHHIPLPLWLHTDTPAPWHSKEEMLQDPKIHALKTFLINTMEIQAQFMAKRLKDALPKMLHDIPPAQKQHIIRNYTRISRTPNGNCILIDYTNFKGEGTKKSERYKGHGWGLLQVLSCMKEDQAPAEAFVSCAKTLLKQRVQNAPKDRGEERWLKGWFHRLDTYLLY